MRGSGARGVPPVGLVWNDVIPTTSLAVVADLIPADVRLHVRDDGGSLPAALADAAILLASGRFPVDSQLLDRAERLRGVIKFGSGTEILDMEELRARGIPVYRTVGANAAGVAEHAVALILSVMRHLPILDHRVRRLGEFDKWAFRHRSHELGGSTVGIVGFGAVGRAVAQRLRGFDVDLLASARRPIDATLAREHGVTAVDLDWLIGSSDVIVLAVPLTGSTRGLIGPQELARMRRGAYLVNISRGAVVDVPAVVDALRRSELGGFATDVFDPEPPLADDPLFDFENVVVTPHVAGATVETFRRVFGTAMQHAECLIAGRSPDERFRVAEA